NVSVNNGCSWTASSPYSWIHTSSSGSGGGSVTYTVDANTTTSSRSGTISVGNQSFTITQAGLSCTYSLSPTSFSPGSGAQSGSFTVTASAGCPWAAATASGWIHTGSSGNGNGGVSYTIDANTSGSSRSGTIIVADQSFTLTQAGTSPTLSLGEAVDNTSLTWTTGGDANWAGENNISIVGGDAAQSG